MCALSLIWFGVLWCSGIQDAGLASYGIGRISIFHCAGLFSGVQDTSLYSGVQSSGLASDMTEGFVQRCQSGYGHST